MLTAHRQFFGNIAFSIVSIATIPMATKIRHGTSPRRTQTAIVFAVITIPFYLIGIFGCHERF
jgi:Na+/melibiose symporter-like transporter